MVVRLLIFSTYLIHFCSSHVLNLLQSTLTQSYLLVKQKFVMLKAFEVPVLDWPCLMVFYAAFFLALLQ